MLVDWIRFISALILLLIPIGLFHDDKVRYRSLSRDWGGYWKQVLTLGLHTIDFTRAILGSLLLLEALTANPDGEGFVLFAPALVQGGVLFSAVLLQTVVCKRPEAASAPLAFLTGLTLGILPPEVAGLALLFTAAIVGGVRKLTYFFATLALSVAGMSFFFYRMDLLIPAATVAGVTVVPLLWSLLFPRNLVLSYRIKFAPEEY